MNAISIAGKPQQLQTWLLEVRAWPVLTVNGQIHNIRQVQHYHQLSPINQICFNLSYDGHTISQVDLTGPVIIKHDIVDDKQVREHELAVWISHKQHTHSHFSENNEISICVACEIAVENVVITDLVTGGGMILLGENDHKISIHMNTPVYRWLLERKNDIFKPYLPDPILAAIESPD